MDRAATASPSRDFLLQKSVLAVLHRRYPASIQMFGRGDWAEKLYALVRDGFGEGAEFCAQVRAEFNSRASQAARAA